MWEWGSVEEGRATRPRLNQERYFWNESWWMNRSSSERGVKDASELTCARRNVSHKKDPGGRRVETGTWAYTAHHIHSTIIHSSRKVEALTDEGVNKMSSLHTMEDYRALKSSNCDTRYDTGEPWRPCAKWRKSSHQRTNVAWLH